MKFQGRALILAVMALAAALGVGAQQPGDFQIELVPSSDHRTTGIKILFDDQPVPSRVSFRPQPLTLEDFLTSGPVAEKSVAEPAATPAVAVTTPTPTPVPTPAPTPVPTPKPPESVH
ncbi:MAG: hypothetical protein V2A74_04300, partial [bacterium]